MSWRIFEAFPVVLHWVIQKHMCDTMLKIAGLHANSCLNYSGQQLLAKFPNIQYAIKSVVLICPTAFEGSICCWQINPSLEVRGNTTQNKLLFILITNLLSNKEIKLHCYNIENKYWVSERDNVATISGHRLKKCTTPPCGEKSTS